MAGWRPFRFATLRMSGTREASATFAQWAESVGFDAIVSSDHLTFTPDALTTLMFLADVTNRIKVGTYVMCIDFHHPAVLARALANIDHLSGGRLEVGLGAGYIKAEYDAAGIPLAPGATRFNRLQEATAIVKSMMANQTTTFDGEHFHLRDQMTAPLPHQQPCPPILLGGGGPRMLKWAAQEADIVSINARSSPAGAARLSGMATSSVRKQADLVHAAASARATAPELNAMIWHLEITTNRREAAGRWLDGIRNKTAPLSIAFTVDAEVSVDDILDSPFLAFGTEAEIAEHFRRVRAELGISYWTVVGGVAEAFAPVLQELAGT